jgi:hypothetical protein
MFLLYYRASAAISRTKYFPAMSLADLIPAENRGPGLSRSELKRAQTEADAGFPEDLLELLSDCLPTGPGFPAWRDEPAAVTSEWRTNLLEGILFNVEADGFWPNEWGERPSDAGGRRARLATLLDSAPRLIPIYGHRAIPNEPLEAGNPVFSVVQIDASVLGSNLEDYLQRQFHGNRGRPLGALREIRFWTALDCCED